MTHNDGKWHTFAEDHGMTDGIYRIIAEMAGNNVTSFKVRNDEYKKRLEALE